MEKETVKIHDLNNNLFTVEVEIKNDRLSMSGEYGGGCGQCLDSVKPKNKEQKRLIEIWNLWHLNDMHSGTEKQERILQELKKKNPTYTEQVAYLKKRRAYSDNGYKYGSGWLKRKLPTGLEEELKSLCVELRQQEADRKDNLKGGNLKDLSPRMQALSLSLDITPKEAEEAIEENYSEETLLEYCGISYFVGTEDEAEERARDYLDVDLWKQSVVSGNTESSFEEWQNDVIRMDGFGHILNSWDGSEDNQDIEKMTYYIIIM